MNGVENLPLLYLVQQVLATDKIAENFGNVKLFCPLFFAERGKDCVKL